MRHITPNVRNHSRPEYARNNSVDGLQGVRESANRELRSRSTVCRSGRSNYIAISVCDGLSESEPAAEMPVGEKSSAGLVTTHSIARGRGVARRVSHMERETVFSVHLQLKHWIYDRCIFSHGIRSEKSME